MNKIKILVFISAILSLVVFTTIGCEKEGPMEKAGKKVDEAVDSAKEAVDK